jgi:hypothetical protein
VARVNSGTLMATYLKVSGLTIKQMVSVPTHIRTVQATLDFGRMIYSTEKAKSTGSMAADTSATIIMERSMVRAVTGGLMAVTTKACGSITRSKVRAPMFGLMVGSIQAGGLAIICMASEVIRGRMADATKAPIIVTKSTDLGRTPGLMVANMKAIGLRGNSMGKVNMC